jgi:anti-anti-sigma factor
MADTGFPAEEDELRAPAGALVATDGDRTAVWLSGEHDLASIGLLSSVLAEAIANEDRDVVVDMAYLTFMDASTLGLLIRSREFLAQRGRRLTLRHAPRCARLLLDLSELDVLLEAGTERGRLGGATALETWVTVPSVERPNPPPPGPEPAREDDEPKVLFG